MFYFPAFLSITYFSALLMLVVSDVLVLKAILLLVYYVVLAVQAKLVLVWYRKKCKNEKMSVILVFQLTLLF